MSDLYYSIDLAKNKFQKLRILFPLSYLQEVLSGVRNVLWQYTNLYNNVKNDPMSVFSRFFVQSTRRFVNVLVLVADLEHGAGAACLELINMRPQPEFIKPYGFSDNNSWFNDFEMRDPEIEYNRNFNGYEDVERILDVNLQDADVNPNYLMQLSLTSSGNEPNEDIVEQDEAIDCFDELVENSEAVIKQEMLNTTSESNNSEFSNHCSTSSYVSGSSVYNDKENYISEFDNFELDPFPDNYPKNLSKPFKNGDADYEEDNEDFADEYCEEYDDDDEDYETDYQSGNFAMSLPKYIRKEVQQLTHNSIPYSYHQITESSHEKFKLLKADSRLNNKQISLMVSIRRRFINRRAATRCRNQKSQIKATLTSKLKNLQNKLLQSQISFNRACQTRNETRDKFRLLQRDFLTQLRSSRTNQSLCNITNWTVELSSVNANLIVVREASIASSSHNTTPSSRTTISSTSKSYFKSTTIYPEIRY